MKPGQILRIVTLACNSVLKIKSRFRRGAGLLSLRERQHWTISPRVLMKVEDAVQVERVALHRKAGATGLGALGLLGWSKKRTTRSVAA